MLGLFFSHTIFRGGVASRENATYFFFFMSQIKFDQLMILFSLLVLLKLKIIFSLFKQ